MMPTLQEIVDTIVSALPKWMRPDTLTEKLADAEADLIKAQDKLDSNPDYAPYIKKVEKAQAKVDSIKSEIETKFPSGLNEVETNNFNETFNNDVQKENTVMKEKINEIKQAENVSTSSSISQMFVDNKQVINN